MEGCIANILKYLLFGSNLLIFIAGCAILGTGIFALFDSSSLITLVDESGISGDVSAYRFVSAVYIFIAIAVFVCILAFFGCCGAIKENKCMLSTYFVLILLMFIMVIVGVIMGLTASLTALEGTLEKTMKNFKEDPSNINISGKDKIVTDAWNQIQTSFKCCGTNITGIGAESNSWEKFDPQVYNSSTKFKVPKSCCAHIEKDQIDNCRKNPTSEPNWEVTGCVVKLQNKFYGNQQEAGIAGSVILGLMIINMLASFAMCTKVDGK